MNAPEVLPEPIRPSRLQPQADATTFGGGPGLEREGQEIQKISSEGGNIAAFEKIRSDQSAVEEAVGSKLSPALTQMLYDPKNGALARISQATSMDEAHKIHDETLKQYDDAAKNIAGDLSGPNQVGSFNRHAFEFGDNLNKTLMAHVDQQLRQIDDKSFNSFVDNTISQAALGWGNVVNNPKTQKQNLQMLDDHATQFGFRNGMNVDQLTELKSKINSNYHASIIDRMLADGQSKTANAYFNENKDQITNLKIRDDVESNLVSVPKQQEALAKHQQEEAYKANMRQAMLDMFDGNLTLSEAQRRFRNGDLDKSDYDILESKLSKPDAAIIRQTEISNPSTFSKIREEQISGSSSPGEIQRMIAQGAKNREITPDDGKYLLNLTKETPPTPRDKQIEANANNVRDFAKRYFAETNFLGQPTNKEKTDKQVDELMTSFYRGVDGSKATGKQIADIRDQVKKIAMQKRFPGLGNLEKAPDVVIDVKGRVTRLLNPDEPSVLTPKYRITPTESQKPDDE